MDGGARSSDCAEQFDLRGWSWLLKPSPNPKVLETSEHRL